MNTQTIPRKMSATITATQIKMTKQYGKAPLVAIPIGIFIVYEVIHEFFEDENYYEGTNSYANGSEFFIPTSLAIFVTFSLAAAAFFGYRYYQSIQSSYEDQKQRADKLNGNLGDYVSKQFTKWKLSVSEREIALFIIKGLPYGEIAKIRGVKEKTVRQQAANIYAKTDIKGRSEFAAWFIEDLL